jgi:hypothetical protein
LGSDDGGLLLFLLSLVFNMRHYTTGFKNRIFAARIYQDALFFFMHETALLECFADVRGST